MYPNVMVSMPTSGHPDPEALCSIMAECERSSMPFSYQLGHPRDVNRNRAVQGFLDHTGQFSHLIFVDDDTLVPAGAFRELVLADKPIVFAPYPMLLNGMLLMSIAEKTSEKPVWISKFAWRPERLPFRVAAAGTGLCCIRRDVFEAIEWPWFEEDYGDRRGANYKTEDIAFCEKCLAAGVEMWCLPHLVCGHMKRVDLRDICTAKELEIGGFEIREKARECA